MAELSQKLQSQVDNLIEQSDYALERCEIALAIDKLEDAWNVLPDPKFDFDESYHISKYIIELCLRGKLLFKAKEWVNIFLKCDLERIDSGEREFITGKVEYEMGYLDNAKRLFEIANTKSKGRCFIDEDKKYKQLLKALI